MNYTEKITLEQAIMLKKKQPFTQVKRILDGESLFVKLIQDIGIENLYANDGYILITRPDYAQYIQGNNPLPDGYGYPSKELNQGRYTGLQWAYNGVINDPELTYIDNEQSVEEWYEVAFKLTDLARVEAEAVVSKMEKTEINAAQCMWLINQTTVYSIFRNGVMVSLGAGYWIDLRVSDKDVYEILTTDYNSLPNDFKALAEPKPSMLAHFTEPVKMPLSVEQLISIAKMDILLTYWCDGEKQDKPLKAIDIEYVLQGGVYEISKQDYHNLNLDDVEALDILHWKAKYEAQASEIAKYLEMGTENASLKLQLQEATASADAKQDRINELEAALNNIFQSRDNLSMQLKEATEKIALQEAQLAKQQNLVKKLVDDISAYTHARQVGQNYEVSLLKTLNALGAPYLPVFNK